MTTDLMTTDSMTTDLMKSDSITTDTKTTDTTINYILANKFYLYEIINIPFIIYFSNTWLCN